MNPTARKTKYTQEQIDCIFGLRLKHLTLEQITTTYNERTGWEASSCAIEHVIRRNKKNYPPVEKVKVTEILEEEVILDAFYAVIKEKKYVPKNIVFTSENEISIRCINRLFGDYEGLEAACKEKFPEVFEKVIDETYFTAERFEKLQASVLKCDRFFITTAVVGCVPHPKALKTIENFCKVNSAKLLVLLASNPNINKDKKYKFSVHHEIPAEAIVFQDLVLNDKLFLSSININAKQANPLLGLKSLGGEGSCILGSPKQFLEAVPVFDVLEVPHHIMTTGAITIPDYGDKTYIEGKAEYLATSAHVLGGLIVEIEDSELSFSRHVQIQEDGTFCDLDRQYFPDLEYPLKITAELVQTPDWHVGSVSERFKEAAKEIVSLVKPKYMTLEDFCDNLSINPFERSKVVKRNKRLQGNQCPSLKEELQECADELEDLCSWDSEFIIMKWGNHDDFLKRWLEEALYHEDVVNHYTGVCLAKLMLEGKQPFEAWMRQKINSKYSNKLTFLTVNDSFIVNGIENGVHGHLGSGGKRNPGMKGLSVYGSVNTGHSHSPAIMGDVFRVGTATELQLDYNIGASAWANTLLIQHKDGSRQLVTVFEGRYKKG